MRHLTRFKSCSSLTKAFKVINRHKVIVTGTMALGVGCCALMLQNIVPIYQAQTQILFEGQDIPFIRSQENVVKSDQVVSAAISARSLQGNTGFKGLSGFGDAVQELKISEDIIRNITVTHMPQSYILNIGYKDRDPAYAALMANAITTAYMGILESEPPAPIQQVQEPQDLSKLFEFAVQSAQNDFKEFKKIYERPVPALFTHAVYDGKVHAYEQAALALAEAKAKLHPFLGENGELVFNEKAPAVLHDAFLRALRIKEDELLQHKKMLAQRYGHKHPKMIKAVSSLTLVREQIAREKNDIMLRIHGEYKSAKARFESAEKPDETLQAVAQDKLRILNDAQQETLMFLESRVRSAQALYDQYQQVKNQNNIVEMVSDKIVPSAALLKKASVPMRPVFPNKPMALFYAALLSLSIGLATAFIIEARRRGYLSGRALEEHLGVSCAALIPYVDRRDIAHKNTPYALADYVLSDPLSPVAEAVRALRLNLKLSNNAKVITVTSSFPNEGKTTLSIWLARLAAKAGESVLLIDGDLRRPHVHEMLGRTDEKSLVGYLSGKKSLEDIIDKKDISGAHIIYGQRAPGTAADALSSDRMEQLITDLRKSYDLVIIDSPACMAVSDARALASLSDKVLYAVAWNKTDRKIVHSSVTQFNQIKNTEISMVLTNIDIKKHVRFGYGQRVFEVSA